MEKGLGFWIEMEEIWGGEDIILYIKELLER